MFSCRQDKLVADFERKNAGLACLFGRKERFPGWLLCF